ncbi:MAG: hypothetical protein ACJ77D_03935, partial [Chloroflexota bacterium]
MDSGPAGTIQRAHRFTARRAAAGAVSGFGVAAAFAMPATAVALPTSARPAVVGQHPDRPVNRHPAPSSASAQA